MVVTITEQLSASHNQVGDRFTGVLASSVKSSSGATIFPRGAHVVGTVVASKGQGKFKGAGALGIEELVVNTIVWDHAKRLRSYELLADEFGRGESSVAQS